MIILECPTCNRTLRAPEEAAGQASRCPLCEALLTVPDEAPQGKVPPGQEPFAVVLAAPPALPASAAAGKVCGCPTCGRDLTIVPELEGERVDCPFCGREFRAPG